MPQSPVCEGGCRCGRLRFRISAKPLLESLCHCTGCQRMTGSAFSTTVTVPTESFQILSGDPVIGGLHGDEAVHHHCDWCKSWVFTRVEPDMGFVNVRATMLDEAVSFRPYMEVQTAEKLSWVDCEVERSFEGFPAMDDYVALVRDYAAWRDTR